MIRITKNFSLFCLFVSASIFSNEDKMSINYLINHQPQPSITKNNSGKKPSRKKSQGVAKTKLAPKKPSISGNIDRIRKIVASIAQENNYCQKPWFDSERYGRHDGRITIVATPKT
jgi:hypothetical protein